MIRLRVGEFKLADSVTFDELDANCLLPIEICLKHLPTFDLPESRIRAFLNGLPTTVDLPDENFLRVTANGKFLGVGRITSGELRSSKIV